MKSIQNVKRKWFKEKVAEEKLTLNNFSLLIVEIEYF